MLLADKQGVIYTATSFTPDQWLNEVLPDIEKVCRDVKGLPTQ